MKEDFVVWLYIGQIYMVAALMIPSGGGGAGGGVWGCTVILSVISETALCLVG